jgi:hypothetical protein
VRNRNSRSSVFLRANRDLFTWKPVDMPGVPRELIEYSLNVHPKAVPKRQRLRRFAHDKREAIRWEIAKLLVAGFIKKVIHSEWIANPVLVRKKNNEWRMRVDYTDLNKHCPKDHFGLPRIDQVVDSTAGCVLLYFLDCYFQNIIRLRSRRRTKSRQRSSPRTGNMPTKPCPSG